jgi:hypothetical protein
MILKIRSCRRGRGRCSSSKPQTAESPVPSRSSSKKSRHEQKAPTRHSGFVRPVVSFLLHLYLSLDADFENCLKLDSNCTEAKTEMEQTQALLAERTALKTRLRQHRSSSNDPDSDDYDDLSDSDESTVDYDDPVTRVIVMRDGPGPAIDESDHDTPFESCTSDYEHEGEYGVPCRYYNSRGCIKGSTCPYRHAPDSKSVRDKL